MNQTAQGLAALGRGPDTMLVHMAPSEVAGLQALAMKHGGTLTINPETGLAEAGFLSTILPMVAGFALGPAGFGLMSSAMAGLTVGGITALTSKSLSKGVMAGLGAYGGAGLGESLMGAGTGSLSSAAGAGATAPPIGAVVPQTVAPAVTNVAATAPEILGGAAQTVAAPIAAPVVPAINAAQIAPTITQAPVAASVYAPAESMGAALARDQAAAQSVGSKLASTGAADTLGAGFKAITASPSAALNFAKANAYPLGALGISALAGMQPDSLNAPTQNQGMIRPFTYSREKVPSAFEDVAGAPLSSKERRYFNDSYTALAPYKAPGPEYMAVGGPVEAMSNGNNIAAYMGQDKFAEGGEIGGYTYDPVTQMYTKKAGEGATMVSPIGGISKASGLSGSSGGGSAGDLDVGGNKNTQVESIEAQSARNQVFNDFVTGLSKMGPTSMLMSGINALFGAPNNFAPVSDAGTSLDAANTAQSMQSMQDALAADTAAAQGTTTGGISNAASSAADGYGTGDTAGFGGGTEGGGDGWAQGGITNLGDYSDGGRLLRGPGDGVSDDIPAMIGQKQQARLADGEFVVPARIVSELGNGSTEAGARQLYAMMDRVQKARTKTIGKDKVATNSRAAKLLPA